MLLGVAFMMGVVLTVVFPSGREFAELTGKQPVDAYSIAYLTVLTRAQHDDTNLRLVYTGQLAKLGRWDEALAALDGAQSRVAGSSGSDVRSPPSLDRVLLGDARSIRLQLMLARARALPEGGSARASALEEVHRELLTSASLSWPASRARELATLSLELEDPALAAQYFLAAAGAEADPSARVDAIADAGRWLRASGDEGGASECFRRAADLTDDLDRKVSYVSAGADALEAQNRPCDAADLLRPFASVSTNVTLVVRAAELSTSCGNAGDAQRMGRLLLELAPDDETYVRAQVARELAAGDPPGALALLTKLVDRHPSDRELRLTTARVAEWSGQPQIALEQWLVLVSSGESGQSGQPRGRRRR